MIIGVKKTFRNNPERVDFMSSTGAYKPIYADVGRLINIIFYLCERILKLHSTLNRASTSPLCDVPVLIAE